MHNSVQNPGDPIMNQDCVIIQTLHGESSAVYFGAEAECVDWIMSTPETIRSQFRIYTVL